MPVEGHTRLTSLDPKTEGTVQLVCGVVCCSLTGLPRICRVNQSRRRYVHQILAARQSLAGGDEIRPCEVKLEDLLRISHPTARISIRSPVLSSLRRPKLLPQQSTQKGEIHSIQHPCMPISAPDNSFPPPNTHCSAGRNCASARRRISPP